MMHHKVQEIKRQQKKSQYLRVISQIIQPLINEERIVDPIYVSRVDLSKDTGICYVYFSSAGDDSDKRVVVENALERLVLYKPSIRKSLANAIQARRIPDLMFLYDEHHEKERRINELLDKVREDFSEE